MPSETVNEKADRRKAEKAAALEKLLKLSDAKLGARVRKALESKRTEMHA